MNSTDRDQPARAAIEEFFDTELMPAAERRRASGRSAMPLAADPSLSSYWTALPARRLAPADFLQPSCLDSAELAAALAAHWHAVGEPELATLAAPLVSLAQALRAPDAEPDTPSAFIYTMF
jgi:hypothetical protein